MRRIDLKQAQTAGLATIRNINRQIVLNYVREREPISRAEIARETALQRSTVSAIVDELQTDGLIEAVGEGQSTGGRPPTLLRLRSAGAIAIGVAVTPTTTSLATSDLAGRVVQQDKFSTDPDYQVTFDRIVKSIQGILKNSGGSIEGIGISLPGLIDPSSGTAIYVPYFKWRDIPIAKQISSAVGSPVTIDNDANAVALAELWFGRPEVSGARDFILVLAAEGIGTGIVVQRQIYRGEHGAAGEFGHMIVGTHAPVACSCGNRDCWEAFSSERATIARYRSLVDNVNPEITFRDLVNQAIAGEREAEKALTDMALCLGIGISNLIVGFSPEAVVVGGEITRAWHLVEHALQETIAHSVRRGLPSAQILPSTLGESPTLRGALSLILAEKFAAAFAA